MSVRKNASIATVAVFFSRIMGLVREMVFAFFFGAGPILDAFVTAFRIPNLLRDLFAEGALSSAFVTVFSKKSTKDGDAKAFRLANKTMGFLLVFMGSLVVLGILFSPQIVGLLASGFSPEKKELTIALNRLLFPFILFVSLAALCMGMLNSKGKFALPQSASTFFNITSILVGLLMIFIFEPAFFVGTIQSVFSGAEKPALDWAIATRAIIGMGIGTLAGGLVQWLVQMPSLFKLGYKFRPSIDMKDADVKNVLALTGPAIIGGAAVQVNVLINTNFASFLQDGSISWLNFAFRLMQFPLGLFGVAIAIATAPALARLVATGDTDKIKSTLRESLQMALFLCIPSSIGLAFLAEPIMALIYQYGHFTAFDSQQASHALMAYSIGLVFYALIKIYQPVFLAHGDSKTPMIISLASIGVNFALNWLFVFVFHFDHWGLAIGTSAVALTNCLLLVCFLRKYCTGIWTKKMLLGTLKITLASLVAVGAGVSIIHSPMGIDYLANAPLFLGRLLAVFVPIAISVSFFFFLTRFLKIEEVLLFEAAIRRKLSKK